MQDIVIYGCGGFGREVLQIIHALNTQTSQWNCLGFVVDPGVTHPEAVHDLPVVVDPTKLSSNTELSVVMAIGTPAARQRIVSRLKPLGYLFPKLVHPRAWIGEHVAIGEGTVICAGACLTTDITVSEHVHINLCATVGHDAAIGAFSTISPGANISGYVTLGECCDIGTGATINKGVSIGEGTVIGAGAAVISTIAPHCTAVGVPAKIIKQSTKF